MEENILRLHSTTTTTITTETIKEELVRIKDEEICVPHIKTEVPTEVPFHPIKIEPSDPDCETRSQMIKTEKLIDDLMIKSEPLDAKARNRSPQAERPRNKNVFYSCSECEFMTKFKWCFDDHVATNHKVEISVQKKRSAIKKYYRCDLCPFKCNTKYNLLRHIKHKHETRAHSCPHCQYATNNKTNLKRHIFSIHLEHECEYCEYKTKIMSNLKRHTLSKHLKEKRNACELKCTHCDYATIDRSNLKKHMLCKHKTTAAKCTYCEFTTKSQSYLKVHVMKHLRDRVKCPHCTTTFTHNKYLILHVKTYHSSENLKWYQCNYCEFRSARREDLVKHTPCRRHGTEEEATNEKGEVEIEEVFVKSEGEQRAPEANAHREAVEVCSSDAKLFSCDQCPYRTNKKFNLRKHCLYRHTDVDKIEWLCCPHCSYKAKTKEHYNKHVRNHARSLGDADQVDKSKWFQCGQCSYAVKSKSCLERHCVLKHTNAENINWIQCNKCSFQAKTKDDFYKHRYYKHSDFALTYECNQCSFIAKTRNQLGVHIVSKHPLEESVQNVSKR